MVRRFYKRKKRWQIHNDNVYRNYYIKKLEEKLDNGSITFDEKMELFALRKARRRNRRKFFGKRRYNK